MGPRAHPWHLDSVIVNTGSTDVGNAANQSTRVMMVSSVVDTICLMPCTLLTIIHIIVKGMMIVGVLDDQGTA